MNESIAGYRTLEILSGVDGLVDKEKQKIIITFIKSECGIPYDLEIEALKFTENNPVDYTSLFYKSMDRFYLNSYQTKRSNSLALAMKLVKTNSQISAVDNIYLT